jgi:hypothetical protein
VWVETYCTTQWCCFVSFGPRYSRVKYDRPTIHFFFFPENYDNIKKRTVEGRRREEERRRRRTRRVLGHRRGNRARPATFGIGGVVDASFVALFPISVGGSSSAFILIVFVRRTISMMLDNCRHPSDERLSRATMPLPSRCRWGGMLEATERVGGRPGAHSHNKRDLCAVGGGR